ncbi:MAG: hypothetical protein SPF17_01870 [Candidatus Mucispirillum faecigallinarum]|nr:hypothetical protein [Candidatus Mucispirillum faecigallinarum]
MNKKNLYKANYDKLDISEKNEILNNIAAHYGFTIKNYAEFERNGISLYTAVYDDNGTEFVFIPGAKSVSLGFKASISYKNEDSAQIENLKDILLDYFLSPNVNSSLTDSENTSQLQSYIENEDYKQADKLLTKMTLNFIDEHTSFLRKLDIEPMLVERRSTSINWVFVKEISSKVIADSPTYLKIYQDIIKSDKKFIIKQHTSKSGISKTQKYEITEHGINVYKYTDISHEEILFSYTSKGYNIPNRNQWEYIAAGGSPLFFQNSSLSVKTQSLPNAFGLYIADNIYKPEIIADDKYIFKAGDNGYFKNYISKKLAGFSLNPFYNTTSIFFDYTDNNGLYARKIIKVDLKKQFKPSVSKKNINKYIEDNMSENNFDNIIYAVNTIKNPNISFDNAVTIIKIYHAKGFINKSYELIEKYINQGINDSEFLYLAGFTSFRMQDYEKAEYFLKRAIYLKRNMPECYQLLAYLYQKQNNKVEMEKALHNLYVLAQDVAENMFNILIPKGVSLKDKDYEDMWSELVAELTKPEKETINLYTITSEVILLDSTVKLINHKGISAYIKYIRTSGSKYLKEIFEKIENSKYIKDETYLSKEDYMQAVDEFNACKNIIYEAENIENTKDNQDYLQDLTNSFFDCSPALLSLAYIYFSNCRLFEADKLFDENYGLCSSLYKTKELPIQIADSIRVLLENFIINITMNILSYGQIQENIDKIISEVNKIKDNYAPKINQGILAIELSVTKDIKYILNWFNINIDIKNAMRNIN